MACLSRGIEIGQPEDFNRFGNGGMMEAHDAIRRCGEGRPQICEGRPATDDRTSGGVQ